MIELTHSHIHIYLRVQYPIFRVEWQQYSSNKISFCSNLNTFLRLFLLFRMNYFNFQPLGFGRWYWLLLICFSLHTGGAHVWIWLGRHKSCFHPHLIIVSRCHGRAGDNNSRVRIRRLDFCRKAMAPACWITFSGVLCLSCGVLLACISALGTDLLCCTTSRTWEAAACAEKGRGALTEAGWGLCCKT